MSQTLHQTKLRAPPRGTAERYLRSVSARFLIRARCFSDRARSGFPSEGPRTNHSLGESPDRLRRGHPRDLVRNLLLRPPPVHLRYAPQRRAVCRHTRTADRGRAAGPGLPEPRGTIRPRRPGGRAPPHSVHRVLLQRKSSRLRVLRAGPRIRPCGDRTDGSPIGTGPDAARESTEVSNPRGNRSGPTGAARREAAPTPPSGSPSPDGPTQSNSKRRTSLTGTGDGLYEDGSHSRRRGHGTGRRGPTPRTREGLVPTTNREASAAARPQLRGEMAEVRALAVFVRHSTSFQRTAFLQSGRPPDVSDDEPRRHARDLSNDATRSGRPVVQARGTRKIAEGNRKGDRSR